MGSAAAEASCVPLGRLLNLFGNPRALPWADILRAVGVSHRLLPGLHTRNASGTRKRCMIQGVIANDTVAFI